MNYKAKTMLTPQEALDQAKAYFGPGGQGMAVVSQSGPLAQIARPQRRARQHRSQASPGHHDDLRGAFLG